MMIFNLKTESNRTQSLIINILKTLGQSNVIIFFNVLLMIMFYLITLKHISSVRINLFCRNANVCAPPSVF